MPKKYFGLGAKYQNETDMIDMTSRRDGGGRAGETAEDIMDLESLFNLQTFGDGGGAGGGAAGAGDGAGAAAANEGPAQGEDLGQVKYGKQEEAQAPEADAPKETKAEPQKPARKASFDELVKGDPDYAREMQKRIDNAINRRFAKAKSAEEQNAKLAPALNLLATKYGLQAGDTDALINAITGDTDLIEQQAMDAGMEPEAYREFQRLKAENEAFRKAEQERQDHERAMQQYQEWVRQWRDVESTFGPRSLQQELQNPTFHQYLLSGLSVMDAFKAIHADEIYMGLVRNAAADARRETAAKIAETQNRPRENATGRPKAATVKADISKLTTNDFDEIMRRAYRGERIKF